ncbi:MAG: PAS domain S-box protein [Burkholderiaceae bacterium]
MDLPTSTAGADAEGPPVRPFDADARVADGAAVAGVAPASTADCIVRAALDTDLLSQFADAVPHLVWSARADGTTDYCNRRFLDYVGASAEAFGQVSWEDALHPDDAAEARAAWARSVAERAPFEREMRLRARDGGFRWHHVCARASDSRGSVRWFGTCTDIHERKQAEEVARSAEERFRVTVQEAPVGVVHTSLDGRVRFANAEFCRMLGYSPDEIAARTWQELTHPDDIEADLALAQRTLAGGLPHYTIEKRYLRKDGRALWVKLFGNFLRDAEGRPVGGVGVAVDISDRVRAQRDLDAVIASIDDHLVTYDAQWRYVLANDGALRMLGKSREELIGRSVWELFPDAVGNEHWDAVHRAVRERQPQHFEFFYPPMGRWFENRVYPLDDGVTVFAADITERKRTEQALAQTEARFRRAVNACPLPMMIHADDGEVVEVNPAWIEQSGYPRDRLRTSREWLRLTAQDNAEEILRSLFEREDDSHEGPFEVRIANGERRTWDFRSAPLGVDERGRRLVLSIATDITERRNAERRREDAARRKDEFLAMLAHELRNPLAPIKNAAYLLRSRSDADGVVGSAAGIIDRQVTHMAKLVDDLLDVARITQGRVRLRREPCELGAIVREVADDHRLAALDAGLDFRVDVAPEPQWVDGDRTRLVQVVGNLVHNALKFTRAGEIEVTCRPADAGRVRLAVRDTGEGLDDDTRARLFEPFVQADHSLDRSKGGLGVGLMVVKAMVELHAGSVQGRSDGIGRGSVFEVLLPTVAPPQARTAPVPVAAPVARRVLVIEDNVDAAESLALMLSTAGAECEVAHDGATGLEKARSWRPDAVVCDIGLPGALDGFAVARALRAREEFDGVRLVALSGYGQRDDIGRALAAGFDRHLLKPADFATLTAALGDPRTA